MTSATEVAMAVDDLWYKKGPDGKKVESARHGRGKRYRVRYADDGGQSRERLFDRKVDAEGFDVDTRASVRSGTYVDPGAGKITVSAYAERWRAGRMHADTTAERVRIAFEHHLYPTPLGRLQMGAVRTSHVQGWVRDRAQVLAPSTLATHYTYIKSMFATATADRDIAVNPCKSGQRIVLPEEPNQEHVIPTPEQVHGLAEALPPRLRALVYVAAGLGLRRGEAWGLEPAHIVFLRREVVVRQQLVRINGQCHLGEPKTKYSYRSVELGEVVANELAEHMRLFPPTPVEIDDRTNPRRPRRRVAYLLFTSSRGNPLMAQTWDYRWNAAVAAVGLPKGFGYHGLRHYFATLLIHAGASVKTVQLALGHATPTITLNEYVGEWPDAVDRTRNLVDRELGGVAHDGDEQAG